MSDLIDRQAAIDALARKCNELDSTKRFDEGTGCGIAKEIIEKLPTADAVPVVRCKDCKWMKRIYDPLKFNVCGYHTEIVSCCDEMDYCSHGERREDDE